MKKILIYMTAMVFLMSIAFSVDQVPIFTSPATSGLTINANTQILTTTNCTAGYKYTIYYGMSSPPNITALSPNIVGTATITTLIDSTYYYQSLCGNGYQPSNYSKLVAWFPLDDSITDYTLQNTTNSSNHVYVGNLSNITTNATGMVKQGIDFNGKDKIIISAFPDMTPYTTTISVWFKAKPTGSNGYIVTLGNGQNNSMGIYVTTANTIAAYIFSNSSVALGGGFVPISTDAWYNAALVYVPNPGGSISLYLNGTLQNSVSIAAYTILQNTELRIGGEGVYGTEYFFNGTIDEVLIYNNTFTNNQMKSLYLLENNDTGYSAIGNWVYARLDAVTTAAKVSCQNTKAIIFSGLALIIVAAIVLAAFGIISLFSGGGNVASLGAVAIGLVGLAVVVMVGYYIISATGSAICLA
jgi:hypothetical protein